MPTTAMLDERPASPPRWAAASMPSARPLTMAIARIRQRVRERVRVAPVPGAVALRLPTIAIDGALSRSDVARCA